MCEPVTLTAIAIGVTAGGMVMRTEAARAQGRMAQFTAGVNADQANRQAADAVARSQLPSMRARMHGGHVVGLQEAAYGASGAVVGAGSAGDVTAGTRIITDLDEEVIRNNAAREAYGYETKAQSYRQQGEYARSEAENAVLESIIGGVGKIAQVGAKSWLDMQPSPQTPTVPEVDYKPTWEEFARISD